MKKFTIFVVCCFTLTWMVQAQDVPPEITDPEEREILRLAIKLNRVSLAYRTVAAQMLLEEANFLAEQLKLPMPRPIQPTDAYIWVVPPWYSKADSTNLSLSKPDRIRSATFYADGVVMTEKFEFSLGGPQNRRYVHRSKIKDEDSILDLFPELARTPSLIDTNGAYQLATQWLAAVGVDLPELERKHRWSVFQHFFWGNPEDLPKDKWTYNPPKTTKKTMLPIFDVKWGDDSTPVVQVTVLGTTKELLDLRIEGGSFLKRPPLIITNAIELNTRPDPPMKQLERPVQEPQINQVVPTNPMPKPPAPFRREIRKP